MKILILNLCKTKKTRGTVLVKKAVNFGLEGVKTFKNIVDISTLKIRE